MKHVQPLEGKAPEQKNIKLCTPCAAGMRAAGTALERIPGKSMKITCEGCSRRRFGMEYIVRGTERKGAGRNGDL